MAHPDHFSVRLSVSALKNQIEQGLFAILNVPTQSVAA